MPNCIITNRFLGAHGSSVEFSRGPQKPKFYMEYDMFKRLFQGPIESRKILLSRHLHPIAYQRCIFDVTTFLADMSDKDEPAKMTDRKIDLYMAIEDLSFGSAEVSERVKKVLIECFGLQTPETEDVVEQTEDVPPKKVRKSRTKKSKSADVDFSTEMFGRGLPN